MEIVRFTSQYAEVAPLYGMSPSELVSRDAAHGQVWRWFARSGDSVVGAVTGRMRPDARFFITVAGSGAAIAGVTDAAVSEMRRPLYARVDGDDTDIKSSLESAGFEPEIVVERFEVDFTDAITALRRTRRPRWVRLLPVADADPDRLFALDNEVRNRVPGLDGWQGNRIWFDNELGDPAAYAVAVDTSSDEYAGLARIWRNPDGPRFGLVGVTNRYQGTPIGPALLLRVLKEAVAWGDPSFATETALTNQYIHRRLKRLGAVSRGLSFQMVRSA